MNQVCPVSLVSVNEKAVRLNALFVILTVLVFLFTPLKWIIYFLCVDFAIRAAGKGKFSPLLMTSKGILNLLKISPQMTDAKPKQFAASLGLIFCLTIAVLSYMSLNTSLIILSIMLVCFAALEAGKGFCIGCEIYHLVNKLKK